MLNQKIEEIKREKNTIEDELLKKNEDEKRQFKEQIDSLKESISKETERKKDIEKRLVQQSSNHDKEMALLRQKVEFYEEAQDQWKKKETALKTEVKELSSKMSLDSKDLKIKYESKISDLQNELYALKDTLNEYQTEIDKKDELHQSFYKEIEDKDKTYKSLLNEKEAKLKEYESQIGEMKSSPEEYESSIKELREQVQDLTEKLENSLAKVKERDEKIKMMTGQFKKEKALLEQNLNFHEINVSELKRQIEENKRLNENALSALEGKTGNKSLGKDMEELKLTFENKIDQLTEENEKNKQFLKEKIHQLTEENENIIREKELIIEDLENKLKDCDIKISTITDDYKRSQEALRNSETSKDRELTDLHDRYKSKIESLENEIDTLKYKSTNELNIHHTKSEDNLKQMRTFFEAEKERIEKRLNEDKNKNEKVLFTIKEENEDRLRQVNEMYEEQIENLQQEMKELEIQNMANNQRFEYENITKIQKIENLEKSLQETKENLEKLQTTSVKTMNQKMANFDEERKSFTSKIQDQNKEMREKDIAIFQITQELDKSKSDLERKFIEKDNLIEEKSKQNQKLKETLETLNLKLQNSTDEFLKKENKINMDLALSNQKNELYVKRINELNDQIEAQVKLIDEKLQSQREEILQEANDTFQKIKNDRDNLDQRLEAKKRQIKELETDYLKKINDLEKNNAVLQEKNTNLENKKLDLEKKVSSHGNLVADAIKREKENFLYEKKSLLSEIENHKIKAYEFELQYVEMQATYEKDLALWQGKNQFLEEQKEQIKNDLNETQKNFEILVQKFKQSKISEQEEAESSQSALLIKLENRHALQLQEIKEQQKIKIADLEDVIKKLEKEKKKLTTQLIDNDRNKDESLNRKFVEAKNSEKRLQEELEDTRKKHNKELSELQKKLDEEKEKSRSKLSKLEQIYKEVESKKNSLIFEHEKEKAKWSVENGQLISQQHDYLEQIDTLSKKRDALVRENEKLLGDIRQLKRSTSTISNSLANFAGSGYYKPNFTSSGIDRSSNIGTLGNGKLMGNNDIQRSSNDYVDLKLSEHFLEKDDVNQLAVSTLKDQ